MIWLQVITAVMAVILAWLNRWPVNLMRTYWTQGSHISQEREFHAANAIAKVAWCVAMVLKPPNSGELKWSISTILEIILLLLVQWLFFDLALNYFTGKPIFYLGKTAWLDRLAGNGLVKAAACIVLIVILNLLL